MRLQRSQTLPSLVQQVACRRLWIAIEFVRQAALLAVRRCNDLSKGCFESVAVALLDLQGHDHGKWLGRVLDAGLYLSGNGVRLILGKRDGDEQDGYDNGSG